MTEQEAEAMGGNPTTADEGTRRNREESPGGADRVAAQTEQPASETELLMEAVVERDNMRRAYARVMANQGSAGVDDMPVEDLKAHLQQHWAEIKDRLLGDAYRPSPVRMVAIPKPGGTGVRMLGIPTVMDRLIQQAVHQVLTPIFDPTFSASSYGFRPGRSAHDAVRAAHRYVAEGRRWVVDIDLEKFFDRVNHDILLSRVARRVRDKRILRLIRRYLQAGMMAGGAVSQRTEGTPQGGPLSPLLSNILLDDLDKELERRGHAFCRYADDCNIYVQTVRSGERVMESITRFLAERLHLRVNAEKSAVARPWRRKFLGYSVTPHREPRLRVSGESVRRFKQRIKEWTRRGHGHSLKRVIEELNPILRGWHQYFHLAEGKTLFEDLDGWIRRKLRCILWKQWKQPRTRKQKLMRRGLTEERSWKSSSNGRGAWWNAGASHMNEAFPKRYFVVCGLVSLLDEHLCLRRST
jgi:RNA-directed DNA polymerase